MASHSASAWTDREIGAVIITAMADELVEQSLIEVKPDPVAHSLNFILDHSAFVRGIGNIKRWFNNEYVNANTGHKTHAELIHINIYIPSYTLHEFDFVKKGTSMMATNARESVRFIEKLFEKEDNGGNNTDKISYSLHIESPQEAGPAWKECLKFKVHVPKVKEFPNFKTKFDSNLIGKVAYDSQNYDDGARINRVNDIQYENSASYRNASENADNEAEMPARLRYLLRTCIYKRYIEGQHFNDPSQEWMLITEDAITKIWAQSFGIDCLNVNEAELLMFQNYNIHGFKRFNPHNNFSMDSDDYEDGSKNILQNTIDTTLYSYKDMNQPVQKHSKRRPQAKNKVGVVNELPAIDGKIIKKERFDAINYAPRGSGELWKP